MKNLIVYFISILSFGATSQDKGDYNWQLGVQSYPISSPYPLSQEISFDKGYRIIDTLFRPMSMGYFNASLSDFNGKLLLYSNGCKINDGYHELITNSEDLSPGSVNDEWCAGESGEYPISDGGMFLTFNDDSLVLLLHQRLKILGSPLRVFVDALFYTSLLRTESSYMIVEKSIPILLDTLSTGRLEAIEGFRPGYWWIIQGVRNSNDYYTIGIDHGEIDTIYLQSIGDTTVKSGEAAAQSVFAPDGSKYARYSPADDLFIFDFNKSTGILSNYKKIHVADSGMIGGLAFSSNSQFLYANSNLDLYQFDVLSPNIQDSKVHIAHYDGFGSPLPTTFYNMQLGPDCRIYMISPNGSKYMHVINNPNLKGEQVDFSQHSIQFPVSNTISLPNFPVFRSFSESPCDASIQTSTSAARNLYSYSIYPNPTGDIIYFNLSDNNLINELIDISLYSYSGNQIYNIYINGNNGIFSIDVSEILSGLYFLRICFRKGVQVERIIKL